MKISLRFVIVGFASCSALLVALMGCDTYQSPPPSSSAPPPAPQTPSVVYQEAAPENRGSPQEEWAVGITIRTESDFYEPLTPYGHWEVIGSYGRCWIPAQVEDDWRPYSNGHWVRTDEGWYWESDEPWAWATYHYGRWDYDPHYGWYWVPQTQWAPAWVSWHEGGGYVGWAPLHPSARVTRGVVEFDVGVIAVRAYVIVEERQFLQPVRPRTVIVNNTVIINKTVNITNTRIVNNTVINEGPRTTTIERSSGQRVQAVPVRDLRRRQEGEAVTRQRNAPPPADRRGAPPARNEPDPRNRGTTSTTQPRRVEPPVVTPPVDRRGQPPARNEPDPRDRRAAPPQEPRRADPPAPTPPDDRRAPPPARNEPDPRDRRTPPPQEPRRVEPPAVTPPVQPPARNEPDPRERRPVPAQEPRRVEPVIPPAHTLPAPDPKKPDAEKEKSKPLPLPIVPRPAEAKPAASPAAPPPAIIEKKEEKHGKPPEKGGKKQDDDNDDDAPNKGRNERDK